MITYLEDDFQYPRISLRSYNEGKTRITYAASLSNGNSSCGSGS